MTLKINVKVVLPRLSPDRPRLDLSKIDPARRERRQCPNQCAWFVPRDEDRGGLVFPSGLGGDNGGGRLIASLASYAVVVVVLYHDKPRGIRVIVLDSLRGDLHSVDLRGKFARYSRALG